MSPRLRAVARRLVAVIGVTVLLLFPTGVRAWPGLAQMPPHHGGSGSPGPREGPGDGRHHGSGGHRHGGGHAHAPLPEEYAAAHIPVHVWTDPRMLARDKEIWTAKCAVCHGEGGDGKGAGAAGLSLKPADLTDERMVAEMSGNYWFWRVSEGGQVEPFKSAGSAMPAWKGDLSVADRWAVIAHAHTLSGHTGPHTPPEHPEMGGGHAP